MTTASSTSSTTLSTATTASQSSSSNALTALVVFGFIASMLLLFFILYVWNNDAFRRFIIKCGWLNRCCDRFDEWQDRVILRRPSRHASESGSSGTGSVGGASRSTSVSSVGSHRHARGSGDERLYRGIDNPLHRLMSDACEETAVEIDSIDDWSSVFQPCSPSYAERDQDSRELLIDLPPPPVPPEVVTAMQQAVRKAVRNALRNSHDFVQPYQTL
ncbi:protein UL140 [Panine betaherpesvirus 2]|uniref:Protein UL140 n=1 Tax=Panine betaherpesvirus 2 TaxID=188763 RepID=Q8QRX1_9BETA|nr:protein UL140 [Panine betaherpesvirus 2]AAM00766.1 protein UL140 [Panine betaherpesvirus 2]QXV67880.1 protein UL140 [Panine betaherpesvirus 2]